MRGKELHQMEIRAENARLANEETRLAAEKVRLDALLAMSAFFSNLNRSFDSSKVIAADIARNVGALLEEGKEAFKAMAHSHVQGE